MTVLASDPRSGLFRFQHHDVPLEWSNNVDERLEDIARNKPAHEIAGRLAAIRRVPDALVPQTVCEAGRAFKEAQRVYDEAGRAYEEARRVYDEAWRPYEEARRAFEKAWRVDKEAIAQAFPNPLVFALSLGPLPDGVSWDEQAGGLRFDS